MRNVNTVEPERQARLDRAVRGVLEAAAARPDELPELPPFLAARVMAVARDRAVPPHPLAAVAVRALPVLALLLAMVSAWAAFESVRAPDSQDEAAMVVLASRDAATDAPLAAMLLPGSDQRAGRTR